MKHFLVCLVTITFTTLSFAVTPQWIPFGRGDKATVEIDANSIRAIYNNGWEMYSKMRITFDEEIRVPNKKKRGKYYIDELTAICRLNKVVIGSVTLYSKDGEVLTVDRSTGEMLNPNKSGHIVTEYIDLMCSEPKVKPGLMV